MTVENRMDSFCENQKSKMAVFGHFGLILAMFLTPQLYDSDANAHIGLQYIVE